MTRSIHTLAALGVLLLAAPGAGAATNEPSTNAAPRAPEPWAFTAPPQVGLADDAGQPRSSLEAFGFTRPTSTRVRPHLETAQRYAQQRQWKEAARELRAAAALAPHENAIQIQLAQALSLGGEYEAARNVWAGLAEQAPESAWLKARMGGADLRMGRPESAEPLLREALRLDHFELSARFHLACLLLARDEVDAARAVVGSMTLLDIGTLATWLADEHEPLLKQLGEPRYVQLCNIVIEGGEKPAQASAVAQPARTAAAYRTLMATLGEVLWRGYDSLRRGDWPGADKALAEAVRLGLRAPAVLNDIAYCRAQLGDIDKASSILKQLVRFYPDSPLVLGKYGGFCLLHGDPAEAVKHLERAHAKEPQQLETSLNLAGAYVTQGDSAQAWKILYAIPAGSRSGLTNWFGQDQAFAAALRADKRYADWLEGR